MKTLRQKHKPSPMLNIQYIVHVVSHKLPSLKRERLLCNYDRSNLCENT